MYINGQIIYDWDAKKPVVIADVWDLQAYPRVHSHFEKPALKRTNRKNAEGYFYELYEIFMPASVAEAEDLLEKRLIIPAAARADHCWKCQCWLHRCVCGADRPQRIYTPQALKEGGL